MSLSFETIGKVSQVFDAETFGSGFTKRLMILEITDGQYTNEYGFDAFKDKVSLFEGLNKGDEVTVNWNMPRTRENNGKWWPSFANVWKLTKNASADNQVQDELPADDSEDDLPF